MTTKIFALTDALGNFVGFRLMPGNRHDSVEVPPLIERVAFDSNALVAELNARGARTVSQHPARAQKFQIDRTIYTWRHLIESFFCKLKKLKRVVLRSCKTDRSFEAMIHIAAAVINSR